jgi:hypothetical protein
MERLVLDSSIGFQLAQASDRVELCDAAGHTIGYFLPAFKPTPEMIEWFEAQSTEEERQRRRAEPNGRTTAEVLDRLKQL